MPRVYLGDFDGPVVASDIGAAFARAFSPDGRAEQPELLAAWMRGEMGHRALTRAQCELISVTRERALAFTRELGIDPAFAPFVRATRARGDEVTVVSE